MADFADQISDERAARRIGRVIQGRGAFRRSKDELHSGGALGADQESDEAERETAYGYQADAELSH